jgi:8-oxo-dGTP diphosphatase
VSEAKKEYPRPSLTADNVVVALQDRHLAVLFIRRARDPFQGMWALPGGFVEPTETVAEAAVRELREETSLDGVRVEEIGCFSKPGRDPRGWVVTVAHLALVPADRMSDVRAGDDAASASWLDLHIASRGAGFRLLHEGGIVRDLAFDHRDILSAAVKRLLDHIDYLAFDLLPAEFTLDALAGAYDAIWGYPHVPRALGDSLLAAAIIQPARDGLYRRGASAEPQPTMLTDGG